MPVGRLRWWILLGICVAAIGWLVLGGLASNIVYFRTASEAEADRAQDGTHVFPPPVAWTSCSPTVTPP
jgi:cytochrome c-type biogenesis protein CcmE